MRPPSLSAPPTATLAALCAAVPGAQVHPAKGSSRDSSRDHVVVRGATHDSTQVRPGDLFAAVPGARVHGAAHAGAAVAAGAVAVLTDAAGLEAARASGVPVLVVPDAAAAVGRAAAALHGHPGRALDVLAVTGTDGKTTTCWLLAAALEGCGVSTGLMGSLGAHLGGEVVHDAPPQHRRTTPEAADLQATLALLRECGARAVALEASSHGLALHRTTGTPIAVGVFTNLGHEHLDFHGSIEEYFAAKASLFALDGARRAVVVVDDEHGRRLAATLADAGRAPVTVSTRAGSLDVTWRAHEVEMGRSGTTFTAAGPGVAVAVELRLRGRFNVANALAALAAAASLGADPHDAARGLGALQAVPGRVETVVEGEVLALVDYAHTPGALAALLATSREWVDQRERMGRDGARSGGRVVLVVGTGGGRDASKRTAMGRAAALGADVVVLTDDNPRREDPTLIRAALRAGLESVRVEGAGGSRPQVHEVPDRAAAVRTAAGLARPGDVVVVAGKGPDRVQLVGDRVEEVDDAAVLRSVLAAGFSVPAWRAS